MKFTFAFDSSVHKVLLSPPSKEAALSTLDVHPEVLQDNVAIEMAQTSAPAGSSTTNSGSFISPLKRRSASKRAAGGGSGGGDSKCSSRPVFHPSPSGDFCAVHWPESMTYVVVQTNIVAPAVAEDPFGSASKRSSGVSAGSSTTAEVDRGLCLEFGWVGTDNHFLVG